LSGKYCKTIIGKEDNLKRIATLALATLCSIVPPVYAGGNNNATAITKAKESAQAWLTLTDTGNYASSWDHAAAYFKTAIAKPDWEKALKSVRSPLGTLKSRKLKSATFTKTLPGAPDGEYVVIQCVTQFEQKKGSIETVTPMHEKDGSWKVSGYYIK